MVIQSDKLSLTSVSPWLPRPGDLGGSTAASPCANAACSNPETAGHCVETELRGKSRTHTDGDDNICFPSHTRGFHSQTSRMNITISTTSDNQISRIMCSLCAQTDGLWEECRCSSWKDENKSGSVWFTVAYRVK